MSGKAGCGGAGQSMPISRGHLHSFAVGDSFKHSPIHCTMSSPLADVWEAAAASPFRPTIGKDSQFTLGFALLFACTFSSTRAVCSCANDAPALLLTGFFGLSMPSTSPHFTTCTAHTHTDRSLINLPLVGAPASIAFGYALRIPLISSC